MEGNPASLDYWREFFQGAKSDIFDVIEHAIFVAAFDSQSEFRLRRDRIAETLYTCHLIRFPAGGVEVSGDESDDEDEDDDDDREKKEAVEKESKVGSNVAADEQELNRPPSNYSSDEIEEASRVVGEILWIKKVVSNPEESDCVLIECLERLQLIPLTMETLQETEIGRAVNCLRKHNSMRIRGLAPALIDAWKVLVDEWVHSKAANIDNSPLSINPSTVEDDEGLPSPPMDEGALFATQTTGLDISENFFDGVEDDGNHRTNPRFDKKQENGRRPIENHNILERHPSQHPGHQLSAFEGQNKQAASAIISSERRSRSSKLQPQPPSAYQAIDKEDQKINRHEPSTRQGKPRDANNNGLRVRPLGVANGQRKLVTAGYGPGRPPKPDPEQRVAPEMKNRTHHSLPVAHLQLPSTTQEKSNYSEDVSIRDKLEIAKRKLHEGYLQAESTKKQRTIQVMELQDIPKQAHNGGTQPKHASRARGSSGGGLRH